MGQYHLIYNKTKKETLRIGSAKLWGQAHSATAAALLLLLSNSNGRGGGDFWTYPEDYDKLTPQEKADQALISAVSGRWAGDSIVVQGDYVEETDPAFIDTPEMRDYEDISSMVADALLIAAGGDECDVVKIIESEAAMSFGSLKGLSVQKVSAIDRNKRKVEKYVAPGFDTPKKAKPKRALKALAIAFLLFSAIAKADTVTPEHWDIDGKSFASKAMAVRYIVSSGTKSEVSHVRCEILTNKLAFKACPKNQKANFENEQFKSISETK